MENIGWMVMVRLDKFINNFKGMSNWNQSTIPHSGLKPEKKHIFYIILYYSDFDILFEILKSVSENLRPNLLEG